MFWIWNQEIGHEGLKSILKILSHHPLIAYLSTSTCDRRSKIENLTVSRSEPNRCSKETGTKVGGIVSVPLKEDVLASSSPCRCCATKTDFEHSDTVCLDVQFRLVPWRCHFEEVSTRRWWSGDPTGNRRGESSSRTFLCHIFLFFIRKKPAWLMRLFWWPTLSSAVTFFFPRVILLSVEASGQPWPTDPWPPLAPVSWQPWTLLLVNDLLLQTLARVAALVDVARTVRSGGPHYEPLRQRQRQTAAGRLVAQTGGESPVTTTLIKVSSKLLLFNVWTLPEYWLFCTIDKGMVFNEK